MNFNHSHEMQGSVSLEMRYLFSDVYEKFAMVASLVGKFLSLHKYRSKALLAIENWGSVWKHPSQFF